MESAHSISTSRPGAFATGNRIDARNMQARSPDYRYRHIRSAEFHFEIIEGSSGHCDHSMGEGSKGKASGPRDSVSMVQQVF